MSLCITNWIILRRAIAKSSLHLNLLDLETEKPLIFGQCDLMAAALS